MVAISRSRLPLVIHQRTSLSREVRPRWRNECHSGGSAGSGVAARWRWERGREGSSDDELGMDVGKKFAKRTIPEHCPVFRLEG